MMRLVHFLTLCLNLAAYAGSVGVGSFLRGPAVYTTSSSNSINMDELPFQFVEQQDSKVTEFVYPISPTTRIRRLITCTSSPSGQPTSQPSIPSSHPTSRPSRLPSRQPTGQPTRQPSGQPSRQPTRQPLSHPTGQPTRQPSTRPTSRPSQPSSQPSMKPSGQPSMQPSGQPSMQPSGQPSRQPSGQPSMQPSGKPTQEPTQSPTNATRRLDEDVLEKREEDEDAGVVSLSIDEEEDSLYEETIVHRILAASCIPPPTLDITQTINGVTYSQYLTQPTLYKLSVTQTVSSIFVDVCPALNCVTNMVFPSGSRRKRSLSASSSSTSSSFSSSHTSRELVSTSLSVTYTFVDYNSLITSSTLVSALSTAVSSGTFLTTLKAKATANGATGLAQATGTSVKIDDLSPTAVPTYAPTSAPTKFSFLPFFARHMEAALVGAFFVFVLCCICAYCIVQRVRVHNNKDTIPTKLQEGPSDSEGTEGASKVSRENPIRASIKAKKTAAKKAGGGDFWDMEDDDDEEKEGGIKMEDNPMQGSSGSGGAGIRRAQDLYGPPKSPLAKGASGGKTSSGTKKISTNLELEEPDEPPVVEKKKKGTPKAQVSIELSEEELEVEVVKEKAPKGPPAKGSLAEKKAKGKKLRRASVEAAPAKVAKFPGGL